MRKEIRRIIMFCAILTVGILLLSFDITFLQLLLLIVAIAVLMPFLLGLVTIAEIRDGFASFKENRLTKIGFLKKLDEIRLFEKKGAAKPAPPPQKAPVPATPKPPAGEQKSRVPFASQVRSLLSSFGSLGTVIKERTKRERKVSEINKMLDGTVTEKVGTKKPAAAPEKETSLPAPPGGAGPAAPDETDPFLSLSGDEFDAGLLDGLDEMEEGGGAPSAGPGPGEMPADEGLPAPELSVPSAGADESSAELDAAANEILRAAGADEGLDAFSGLESPDGSGADSELGDLDNISLDEIDMDVDLGEEGAGEGETAGAGPPAGAPAAAPAGEAEAVKTAWIPSDAPKDADLAQDQIGTQSDMAAFAGGASGTDEDLLSSIASDVKTTVKQKDISLLRELKDFKAPATQIEGELSDMYKRLNAVRQKKDAPDTSTNEIK